ncbi:hypothetical protein DXH95_02930 [Sphingorhabdus pulchriflava]|uniref:Uncharacterized protein n=1 Tax=Sphingorhabdus pulchriflava TaxID=2292257 RepID=A0A371BFL7_9SPHN|nr:hypothetical protein [Sphingorhabdus pulchriflava]RDV06395.1 hypothetical protein DXH95_02930 [Sphingorhabdus pulchriflava]
MTTKLKGSRLQQLKLLDEAGAVSRETAVATSIGYNAFRPGTLSRMIGEGLVHNGYLPYQGDSRRRLSHYWLSDSGIAVLQGARHD